MNFEDCKRDDVESSKLCGKLTSFFIEQLKEISKNNKEATGTIGLIAAIKFYHGTLITYGKLHPAAIGEIEAISSLIKLKIEHEYDELEKQDKEKKPDTSNPTIIEN